MNKAQFDELVKEHGSDLVWFDEEAKHYTFTMGDGVDDDFDFYIEMEDQLLNDAHPGIEWCVAMGDDIVSWISVKSLEVISEVPRLEEFIIENIGDNCYSREINGEDDEDEEDDDY